MTPSGSGTSVTEDVPSTNDTYTLALTRAPAAGETVTVTIIFDAAQLQLSRTSVTFDAEQLERPGHDHRLGHVATTCPRTRRCRRSPTG